MKFGKLSGLMKTSLKSEVNSKIDRSERKSKVDQSEHKKKEVKNVTTSTDSFPPSPERNSPSSSKCT